LIRGSAIRNPRRHQTGYFLDSGFRRNDVRLVVVALAATVAACAAVPEPPDAPEKHDRNAMWQKSLARPPLAVSAVFDARGRLWLARAEGGHVLVAASEDRGASFSAPVRVNPEPELIAADGENRPKLAFGRSGELYVSWTQSLETPFAGHVRFARSLDGGKTFSAPITVNSDRAPISHRFDALIVDGAGRVHVLWLDRRDKAAADRAGSEFAGISLYTAVSEDGGASFGPNRRLAEHSCECCRIALTNDTDGTPVALWRAVFGRNIRDHALLRLDGSSAMTRLPEDHWAMDACPHHGPSLSIAPDGTWHATWFTGDAGRAGLYYARSADRGRSFSTPLAFGDNDAQAAHPSVIARGQTVALAWKEFDGTNTQVRVMLSTDGGRSWSTPRMLATTTDRSDHPQLVADGKQVYLAWNSAREGFRLVAVETP
jgi:hypothetical protein